MGVRRGSDTSPALKRPSLWNNIRELTSFIGQKQQGRMAWILACDLRLHTIANCVFCVDVIFNKFDEYL